MIFVRSFKGYEDKTRELDEKLNDWLAHHKVEVVDVKCCLGHEPGGRAGSGDVIYTLLYKAEAPIKD